MPNPILPGSERRPTIPKTIVAHHQISSITINGSSGTGRPGMTSGAIKKTTPASAMISEIQPAMLFTGFLGVPFAPV